MSMLRVNEIFNCPRVSKVRVPRALPLPVQEGGGYSRAGTALNFGGKVHVFRIFIMRIAKSACSWISI